MKLNIQNFRGKNNKAAGFSTLTATCLILLLSAGLSTAKIRTSIRSLQTNVIEREPLYLPEIRKVKLVTLGFDNLASDILWFNTINYFGKQIQGQKDFKWLSHMCSLVTDLDSRAVHVFEFCSTMLSWVAKQPADSEQLLTKAISTNPTYWRYLYLRGFTRWYFLEDKASALSDLLMSSKLPEAPHFVASIASSLMTSEDSPETAIAYLEETLSRTQEQHAREALIEKLKLAYMSGHFSSLGKAVEFYQQKTGKKVENLEQLVEHEIVNRIPPDPFGGTYFIDAASQEIKSTTGKTGLTFQGKTAKTGLAKHH